MELDKSLTSQEAESDESVFDGIDKNQMAALLNQSFLTLDEELKSIFLEDDLVDRILDGLVAKNYNNMTQKQRVILFATVNAYCSNVFGANVLKSAVRIKNDYIDNEVLSISDEGQVFVYKGMFSAKNQAIAILGNYIYELRKHIATSLVNTAFNFEITRSRLKGLAKIYYENMDESVIFDSWSNYRDRDDNDYVYQPIILDSNNLAADICYEYVKLIYKKYGVIDRGMSEFLYDRYMKIYAGRKLFDKERKRIILQNRQNSNKNGEEVKMCRKYLARTCMDFSTFNDQEFYELFTSSYILLLQYDRDGKMGKRITNLTNELIHRVFNEYDTDGVEFPEYTITCEKHSYQKKFVRKYLGKIEEVETENVIEVFQRVLLDISLVAQKNMLFTCTEEEKQQLMDMMEWCDLKNHDYSAPEDAEITSNGLNIILQKVTETLCGVQNKVQEAIEQTQFLPKGKSVLKYDNKEAYFDYHEFKNGRTRQEVSDELNARIRADIAKMKAANSGQGGR